MITHRTGRRRWQVLAVLALLTSCAEEKPEARGPAGSAELDAGDASSGSGGNPALDAQSGDDGAKAPFDASASLGEPFTLVVLPDTQKYSEGFPDTFHAQTQWIADNVDSLAIRGVLHLGDIVNSSGNLSQWLVADAAMKRLDGVVPSAVAHGNHDSIYSSSSLHPAYFGHERFAAQPGFCGAGIYTGSTPARTFAVCQELPNDILVIATGFIHNASALDAETTIEDVPDDGLGRPKRLLRFIRDTARAFPTHDVIVLFHQNLQQDGTRAPGYDWVFTNVIAPEPNIFMVLNGHELGKQAEAHRATSVKGRTVHELLINYQSRSGGGDGWLRLLHFTPKTRTLDMRTYSPTLDQYEEDDNSSLSFAY
jgi:hypothetical protein